MSNICRIYEENVLKVCRKYATSMPEVHVKCGHKN